jgi:hypothetical protein
MRNAAITFLVICSGVIGTLAADAVEKTETHERTVIRQVPAGASVAPTSSSGTMPGLAVEVVQPEVNAQSRSAKIQVSVNGIQLIDPDQAGPQAAAGQGHLHYRVDGGPVIATTSTKLSLHQLTPGDHRIDIALAGNDHQPIGPKQTVDVKIP